MTGCTPQHKHSAAGAPEHGECTEAGCAFARASVHGEAGGAVSDGQMSSTKTRGRAEVAWRDAARAVFRLASLRCGAGAGDGQPGHCTVPVRGEFARVCLRPGLRQNADYGNLLWWKWWQNQGEIAKMARSPKFMAQWQRNPGGGGHEIWQSA
jgi:hypothetical protein